MKFKNCATCEHLKEIVVNQPCSSCILNEGYNNWKPNKIIIYTRLAIITFVIVLTSIFLFSCNKQLSEKTNVKQTIIDTTINLFNPLQKITSKNFLFEGTKIEHQAFTITSVYNKKTGMLETTFEPKKEVSVKVNKKIIETEKQKVFSESTKQERKSSSTYFIIFLVFIIIGYYYYLKFKFNLKKQKTNE